MIMDNVKNFLNKNANLTVMKVTTFSKYLAVVLILILPFLGAWIGYEYGKTLTLEKVVEDDFGNFVPLNHKNNLWGEIVNYDTFGEKDKFIVEEYACDYVDDQFDTCFRISKSNINENEIVVDDLAKIYHEKFSKNNQIQKLFFDKDKLSLYFIDYRPESSGCCGIVKYDLTSSELTKMIGFVSISGDVKSPTGRYISRVLELESGGKLEIYDLKTETVIHEVLPRVGETFYEGPGYAGMQWRLDWINDHTLSYAVYNNLSQTEREENEGYNSLIEYRTLDVN